jgi:hypothetical protein
MQEFALAGDELLGARVKKSAIGAIRRQRCSARSKEEARKASHGGGLCTEEEVAELIDDRLDYFLSEAS